MKHGDMFTGMAGFVLAASWAGYETVKMCENDPDCLAFLKAAWPGIPIDEDARNVNTEDWKGLDLFTAGPPCQPVSYAGKRKGEEDDRWLWPAALRVAREARPRWCLFENPPGIGTLGLDRILDDLEDCGYEAWTIDIPACAMDAPHIRQRYWIVGHNDGFREPLSIERKFATVEGACGKSKKDHVADANIFNGRKRTNRENWPKTYNPSPWSEHEWIKGWDGKSRRIKPGVPGLVDGLPQGIRGPFVRIFGNAIVPQVAYEIIMAIRTADEEADK